MKIDPMTPEEIKVAAINALVCQARDSIERYRNHLKWEKTFGHDYPDTPWLVNAASLLAAAKAMIAETL